MSRTFRGATRQRGARQRPDAEVHLVDAVVAWCKACRLKVATEVDRGMVIADVLAYEPIDFVVVVFEVKANGMIAKAVRQVAQHSANYHYVVVPKAKRARKTSTSKMLRDWCVGLVEVDQHGNCEKVVGVPYCDIPKKSRDLAIRRIEEAQTQ